jgi:phosphoribosyl 1,2-cyclic phosphodiesterase
VRATIWGCRGSIATPGPATLRYGGNTSCVEVRSAAGDVLILDAGTGLRPLGVELMRDLPARIDVLLTHLHVDHLEGLGFFAPLWASDVELHIWGPRSTVRPLSHRIEHYFSPPLFPVGLGEGTARLEFHDAPEGEWMIGGVRVTSQPILHPGATVGYRLEEQGRSLAYVTDHEPALASDLATTPFGWVSGAALAFGADVLIHDAQYTAEEYGTKVGWGHSSVDQVVTFATRAKADQLLLFHHDPSHDDDAMDAIVAHARETAGGALGRCAAATEGVTLDIGPSSWR